MVHSAMERFVSNYMLAADMLVTCCSLSDGVNSIKISYLRTYMIVITASRLAILLRIERNKQNVRCIAQRISPKKKHGGLGKATMVKRANGFMKQMRHLIWEC